MHVHDLHCEIEKNAESVQFKQFDHIFCIYLFCVQGKRYSCGLSGNSTVLCAVGNPLTIDDDVRFTVRLDPSKVVATAEKLNLTLRVNT